MISTDQNSDQDRHWNRFLLSAYNTHEEFLRYAGPTVLELLRHIPELRRSIISTARNFALQPATIELRD